MFIEKRREVKRHIHQAYKQTDDEEKRNSRFIDPAQFLMKYIYAQEIHCSMYLLKSLFSAL
jgi:hypothetical protein